MATRSRNKLGQRAQFVFAGLRWYMRTNRTEVVAKWTISAGLVAGGFYTASLGQSFTAGIAFGGVALMNIEMARIIHYLASTNLPPPNYDNRHVKRWPE